MPELTTIEFIKYLERLKHGIITNRRYSGTDIRNEIDKIIETVTPKITTHEIKCKAIPPEWRFGY